MFKYLKRLFTPENEHWEVEFNPETGLNTWSKYRWGELQYTCRWYNIHLGLDGKENFNVNGR